MRLKTPHFWYDTKKISAKVKSTALLPFSFVYGTGHKIHQKMGTPYQSSIPVLCIGNLVSGGSGKTPAALAVMQLLKNKAVFKNPVFLSRGYGGALEGPLLVDGRRHTAGEVGDEPLLLARWGQTIISSDREKGARYAEQKGCDLIVMDDGMQNRSLAKTLHLVVVDGLHGFGNGRLLPAGPLREPLAKGIERSDAFIMIGHDSGDIAGKLAKSKPVFKAQIRVPDSWINNHTMPYVAFAGMGQPDKFLNTLLSKKVNIVGWHSFADHHPYSFKEMEKLAKEAERKGARLITTEKDLVRIPLAFKKEVTIDTIPVTLEFEQPQAVFDFLIDRLNKKDG